MALVRVSKLSGTALDWAVSKLEGYDPVIVMNPYDFPVFSAEGEQYSTNWTYAGPVIDKLDGFMVKNWLESIPESKWEARIHNYAGDWIEFGPTMLVAAMRCYVASKYGKEIDIPEILANAMANEHENINSKSRKPG